MDKPVIILGAKGIAHPALEIFNSNQVIVYGLLDEDSSLHGTEINNVPVLGGTEDEGFLKLIGKKTEAFVAVDDKGTPVTIPQLVPESEEEIQRFDGALRRKQLSLVLAGKMNAQDASELKALFS